MEKYIFLSYLPYTCTYAQGPGMLEIHLTGRIASRGLSTSCEGVQQNQQKSAFCLSSIDSLLIARKVKGSLASIDYIMK